MIIELFIETGDLALLLQVHSSSETRSLRGRDQFPHLNSLAEVSGYTKRQESSEDLNPWRLRDRELGETPMPYTSWYWRDDREEKDAPPPSSQSEKLSCCLILQCLHRSESLTKEQGEGEGEGVSLPGNVLDFRLLGRGGW